MHSTAAIYAFGGNREGQTSVANGEDNILSPTPLSNNGSSYITPSTVSRIVLSQKQTYLLTTDGSVLSCGENDSNELGRHSTTGFKRSKVFQRIDAIEAFTISDIACGEGFVLISTKDGKIISWGLNSLGQLGCGDREFRDKPKLNTLVSEPILQLSAGSQHVLALSKNGNVLTWGANRKGQLGDGQLTSCHTPKVIPSLRHRPVISIACGENHSMVMTIGGNVYSWGENTCGQLGLGDTTHRLRPEVIRTLRTAKARYISAGKQHSMAVSSSGLLFAFGSNAHGQCGLGLDSSTVRIQSVPTVVERLRQARVLEVSCGCAHTLVLALVRTASGTGTCTQVFSMGLNSSGQLGLGTTVSMPTPTPVLLLHAPVSSTNHHPTPIGICTGPLSYHSFILADGVPLARPSLPSIDLPALRISLSKLTQSPATATAASNALAVRSLREMLAAAFSSISVLNASFRVGEQQNNMEVKSSASNTGGLCIDLESVREAYALLFAVEKESQGEQIIATLGRATLQLADRLKECPWDDQENLAVFLIVLENPLMLRPSLFHIAIERVVSGILALPRSYRVVLFGWLRSYASEYFGRTLQVLQGYLAFALTNKTANIDPAPAVLVLNSLYRCNLLERILPNRLFYCPLDVLSSSRSSIDLLAEWDRFKAAETDSKVFNLFSYPFFIDVVIKNKIMQKEFNDSKRIQIHKHLNKYIYAYIDSSSPPPVKLPTGVKLTQGEEGTLGVHLEVVVNRETLLRDLLAMLTVIISQDITTLKLPLRVVFTGEDAVDQGGVTKELFTLAIKQLIRESGLVKPCGSSSLVWFHSTSSTRISDVQPPAEKVAWVTYETAYGSSAGTSNDSNDRTYTAYVLGLLVGMAAYHGVLTDLPLPTALYKVMTHAELTLEDLSAADSELARGLRYLLEFEEGSIQEAMGVTFTASQNPLLGDSNTYIAQLQYAELKAGGGDVYVDRSNRGDFVKLFVSHALYGCVKHVVDPYISGVRTLFDNKIVDLCTHEEVEVLLCGTREIGDLSELRMNTVYKGADFHDEHPVVQWFWDVLSELPSFEKRQFLHFVTGSDRVPVGGISRLGLTIQGTSQPSSALPASHTCFNVLDLPSTYLSKEQLKEKLYISITHHQGFGFA